jgi:hypothetical protein
MKRQFENIAEAHKEHNDKLMNQIDLFKKLQVQGNVGIKFEEMNLESILTKLKVITQDNFQIFNGFN